MGNEEKRKAEPNKERLEIRMKSRENKYEVGKTKKERKNEIKNE